MNSRTVAMNRPMAASAVCQHVGRVGDDDLVIARIDEIDMVVADAERGDDLQLRKFRDHGGVDAHEAGHRHAADALRDGRRQPAEIALVRNYAA